MYAKQIDTADLPHKAEYKPVAYYLFPAPC